jgi:hypothetical protein
VDDTAAFEGPFAGAATRVHDAVAERRRTGAALGWARAVGWFALLWWFAGVLGFVALWRFGAISIDAPLVIGVACWAVFTSVLNTLIRVRNPSAVIGSLFLLLIPPAIGLATIRAEGPVGTRTLRPIAAADVRPSYRQAVGHLELDFSHTHFSTKQATNIDARVGTGAVIITVPDDVAITVNTKIQTGGYAILDRRTAAGIGQAETLRFTGCPGAARLHLRLRGGAGFIEVKRVSDRPDATCVAPA